MVQPDVQWDGILRFNSTWIPNDDDDDDDDNDGNILELKRLEQRLIEN